MKARIFAAGRPLLQNHDWPLGVECAWPAAMQPVKTVGAAYRPRWPIAPPASPPPLPPSPSPSGSSARAATSRPRPGWRKCSSSRPGRARWKARRRPSPGPGPTPGRWRASRCPAATSSATCWPAPTAAAIAFGPGHVFGTPLPGETGNSVIGAHRDTHFAFLRELRPGEEIVVQKSVGGTRRYRVTGAEIVDKSETRVLAQPPGEARLTLITCYPFDALRAGGPLRYVVTAKAI
jgi:LPXTG-site transpeptidase (sortase) family protein